eukprot:TRINITY_DN41804_c0_g1_i1.p1 TRINITY_DN41804_c0_g1~~TRINITY_DN41804_c0_g1_i1.p1  ORF type:complete len:372 (+),score=54.94 TRINITY_DN41804_c0_g1_i1:472-1587(+)
MKKEKVDSQFFEKNMLSMKYMKKTGVQQNWSQKATCQCQMLRSSSQWSSGLSSSQTEKSIQMAYLNLILNAKHFIYIENQFFISSSLEHVKAGGQVQNLIAESLYQRIVEANKKQQKFKVLILLPLLPAFAGEINDETAGVLRIQLHLQYETICRGEYSLFERLKKQKIEPRQYIKFIGLRTHDQMNNIPVTELIYIHSKCMIIDDAQVIIGSANINDRSMAGNRDSEIAMVIEDQVRVESLMNGNPFQARKFAHEFRSKIWQEIFGMTEEEVMDPLSSKLWEEMESRIYKNTLIYRQIFGCYPDDVIQARAEAEAFKIKNPNLELYNEKKNQIQGFAVDFPLDFLKKDILTFQVNWADLPNLIVPMEIYT